MFVWAGNARKFMINEKGKVKDHNLIRIPPKIDIEGHLYVEKGGSRYYIAEMVLANHGKPPHKNRLPRPGEVPGFIDDDKTNVHIDNLQWVQEKKSKKNDRPSRVTDQMEDYVWSLLKQGVTYYQIQDRVAKSSYSDKTISMSQIAHIRKKRSEAASGNLTPRERLGLDSVKRSLGETDDEQARRQTLAKEDAKKQKSKIKKKAEREAEKEVQEKARQEAENVKKDAIGDYSYKKTAPGWYSVFKGTKQLNGKMLREDDAKAVVKTLKKGGKEADELLEALAIERENYDR